MSDERCVNVDDGLELARCAYTNLNNMVDLMPTLRMHPLLPLVKRQLQECIKALGDEGFCDVEDQTHHA